MFRWFHSLSNGYKAPTLGDETLEATISQLQLCRRQLLLLMDECRLALQMTGVTESELEAFRSQMVAPEPLSRPVPVSLNEEQRQRGAETGVG